jgi:hypothetical protein
MPFLDVLDFHTESPTSQVVILDSRLRYQARNGVVYTVPAGFRTDLASVPWWLRSLAPPWHQSGRAGVLHDCAYRWDEVWKLGRDAADELLYAGLRDDHADWLRSQAMLRSVRWFGAAVWERWRIVPEPERGVRPQPPV